MPMALIFAPFALSDSDGRLSSRLLDVKLTARAQAHPEAFNGPRLPPPPRSPATVCFARSRRAHGAGGRHSIASRLVRAMDGVEPVRACFCERLQVCERSARLLGALLALSEVSTSASRSAAGLDGNPDWFNESQIFVACRLGFIAAIHLWLGYMCASSLWRPNQSIPSARIPALLCHARAAVVTCARAPVRVSATA